MNGTAAESHQAGEEARRDTVSSTAHSGTDTRYNAMLRYLRGLYVRSPQTQPTASTPKAPSRPKSEPDAPVAEPPDEPSKPKA